MKKTFRVTHPKKKPARVIDSIRSDVRKYMKRERRKELPKGVDFWDFDCRFGDTEESAVPVHWSAITDAIGDAEARELDSFYIEILAKPGRRGPKKAAEEPTVQSE